MEPETSRPQSQDAARPTAMIVDDEESIRDVCQLTLSRMGFEVEAVSTGDAAWARLQAASFDLVLTDIYMPGSMNGARLVTEIKQRYPTTDVIMMTGLPELETAIPALKSGAADYLSKPFSQGFLESVVARCMEKRRLSEELSREKIMRAELEAAYRELQKVERLKEAILARVHHELRAPIAVALLAAECLNDEAFSEKGRGLVRRVRQGVITLQERVEEILLYAELQRCDFDMTLVEVDLRQLLESLVARLKPQWQEKNLSVEFSSDPALGPLSLDAGLVESACKHLLQNAIKFSPGDSSILVTVKKKEAQVLISFKDSGIGIPKEQMPRLSDAFYQVAEFLTREVGGLGLGLAIVRRVAEAHGGSVQVRSALGEGSTFTISLPLKMRPPARPAPERG